MREQPRIPENHLRACLQEQYDFYPITLDFLPLGLDYNAGVYRVVSEQGTAYLLKVKSGSLYEPSCLVPRYLSDQGITSVVAPIPTKNNTLWTRLENWTVIVYAFLDGDTSWTGMTDEQWNDLPGKAGEGAPVANIPICHLSRGSTSSQSAP
jgi:spectinomycin phosphotransferase